MNPLSPKRKQTEIHSLLDSILSPLGKIALEVYEAGDEGISFNQLAKALSGKISSRTISKNLSILLDSAIIVGTWKSDRNVVRRSYKVSGEHSTTLEFLEKLPSVLSGTKYCTCFVGYGQPDLAFAERIVKELKQNGVSCWLYSLDYTPGEVTWREIGLKRREAEKMIVLCSAQSLIRDGLLKEIEEQIDEDPDKLIPVSLDNLWKENGFLVMRASRDLKPFLLMRNYADFSDESMYGENLDRLLKGLERKTDKDKKS